LVGVEDVVGVVLGVLGVLWVEVGVEVCVEVGVLCVAVLVVWVEVVVGVQLTLNRLAPSGSEGIVPGGKSRVSVEIEPPSSLIVTTQGSAEEADGRAAMPITTATAVIAPTTSFRLRNTVAQSPPAGLLEQVVGAATTSGVARTLLPDTVVCNGEPSAMATIGGAPTVLDPPLPAVGCTAGCTPSSSARALRLTATAENTSRKVRTPHRPGRSGSAIALLWPLTTAKGGLQAMSEDRGLRERMVREGEEAIGKLAQELLENPVVSKALSGAFETRERAMRAQELAMGALNLPSASDLERLTRRLRSVSQRLEAIEDGLDRLEQRIEGLGASSAIEQRLAAIEEKLDGLQKPQPA
jgi:hypothetical protein